MFIDLARRGLLIAYLVTAAVFALCLSLVYVASEHIRSKTFFHDLRSEAVTKAHLFLGGQVDSEVM